jgi:hypothetical protein
MSTNNTNHSSNGLTKEQPVAPGNTSGSSTQGTISNIDEAQPIVTTKMGVNLSEQQKLVVRKAADGNVRPMTSRSDAHLNEPDWDLDKMLLRENLVAAFQWDLTAAVGSEISITGTGSTPTDVPQDLLKNDISATPFLRFQWMKFGTCKVRAQLTGSRFHQGRGLLYFVPTMLPKTYIGAAGQFGPKRATQNQHVFLDPSNGTVVELSIPFRYNKGFIDLVFGDVLGQLRFQVLNQLQAASGASTSVEVKIFVSFEDTHFRVPRPGGASFENLTSAARANGLELVDARRQKEDALRIKKLEKELTRKAEEIKRLTPRKQESDDDITVVEYESGMFEKGGAGLGKQLDHLVDDLLPREVTGAIAGILLDKPAVTEYPEPLVNKDAQYMSSSRGVEKLERMTLEPSAQYLTSDQFGDSVDEMDMKFLLKKPVYLETFNWSSTQAVGTTLYTTTVSPTHIDRVTSYPTTGPGAEPSIMLALANLFTYWRGGFVLIFQMIGTAFHEGRLDFCNHPGTTTVPSTYSAALSQYVNSQTIRNTNNTVEVRIPFHSDTPWKRIWQGEPLSDIAGTSSTVRSMDFVTGCFSVRVAVPLKNPNNVANNIDVNIFLAAADDFEFHTLSIIGGTLIPFVPALRGRRQLALAEMQKRLVRKGKKDKKIIVETQAGDLNTDDKTDKEVVVLGVGSVYTKDPPIHHFGETYSSLREACKRYWQHSNVEFTTSPGDSNLGHFTFSSSSFGGLAGYLAHAYRLFRGPLNGKLQMFATTTDYYAASSMTGFLTNNPQPALFSTGSLSGLHHVLAASNTHFDPRQPPLVRFSCNQVAEFQAPFQSIYHSLLMDQELFDLTPSYFDDSYLQYDFPWCVNTSASDHCQLTTAYAFADETRFGVFLGFPPMNFGGPEGLSYPNPGS